MKLNLPKTLILILFIAFSATSCNNSPKQGDLTFFNDFESYQGWNSFPFSLLKGTANSGLFSCITDSNAAYSYAFSIDLGSVNKQKLSKITASAMVMRKTPGAIADLVIQVDNKDGKNIEWVSARLDDSTAPYTGSWSKLEISTILTINKWNDPSNKIKVYVWNIGKVPVFVDDIEINFEL